MGKAEKHITGAETPKTGKCRNRRGPITGKAALTAVCLVMALHTGTLDAANADTLSISASELLEAGIENSLRIKSDLLGESVSENMAATARAGKYPDLDISLEGGYLGQPVTFRHGLTDPEYPESPHWLQNYGITLNQPIYKGGELNGKITVAETNRRIAELVTSRDISEVKLELLERYLNLICMYKQADVLRRNIEESQRRNEDIRRMKREGLVTENDVLRSEMQLTDDRLSLSETDNGIRLISKQLDIWLGLDENTVLRPDTTLLSENAGIRSYEEFVNEAYENGHQLLIARKKSEAGEAEIQIARSAMLPHISLYASNTLARPITRTMTDIFINSWNAGITISYPISSLYKSSSAVKQKRYELMQLRNEEELQKQKIRMEIEEALTRHREACERVEALKITKRQAEENYRIMRNRYMNSLAILTDLMDANAILLDAELRLTSARADAVYNGYLLKKICGTL